MRPAGQPPPRHSSRCWRAQQHRQLAGKPLRIRQRCRAAISDDVQAYITDCFSLLRAYKAMSQQLGPAATQHARLLTSPSQRARPAAARQEALQTAASTATVDIIQLAELVSLRQRLLHEIPTMQASVARVRAEQDTKQAHRPAITATNCNLEPAATAPAAASQWVRAKQYRSHHHREQEHISTSSEETTRVSNPALPMQASWIQRLGFSDMMRAGEGTAASSSMSNTDNNAASHASTSTQMQQTTVNHTAAAAARLNTHRVQSAVTHQPQHCEERQQELQQSYAASLGAEPTNPEAVDRHHQQHEALNHAEATDRHAPRSSDSMQPAAAPAARQLPVAEPPVPEVPSAAPARLRTALLAAAKYKSIKPVPSSVTAPSSSQGNDDSSSSAFLPPSQSTGLNTSKAIEYGDMANVYARSRNRGNADEAALLVCP